MNYITATNFEKAKKLLVCNIDQINRTSSPNTQLSAGESWTVDYFESDKFQAGMCTNQRDLPWSEFKSFPREDEVYDLFA